MIEQNYLDDALRQFRELKGLADRALAQVDDAQLVAALDPESNSIAVIMKHMAGNMRSRWTDFLTTDGEKPDRDRDREFVLEAGDTPAAIRAAWEEGWGRVFAAVSPLTPADLAKTIRIRGEAHSVVQAINRQLTHYAGHVFQIVLLAKHFAGPRWHSLSIPRGRSQAFNAAKAAAANDKPRS
ncbi:MAG TPA: DUF1572 family protein [Candidatus Eisenbacteria bacterium]|nr:DUF1572 family protein [Candidatus Eisenbacteria bacterium]